MTDAPEKPSKVIDLAEWKRENTPHLSGNAKCLACAHTWVAVAPVGTFSLECPRCSLPKGVFVGLTAPQFAWACPCGCVHFYISPEIFICALCGLEPNFDG